jgi:flavin reductase ActVB
LLIVCIDRAIASHPDFAGCIGFTVNVLGTEHVPLAQRFATRGGNKFGAPSLYPDELGLPALSDALVRAACTMYARHDIGDHTILIGMVEHTAIGSGEPVVYFTRRYHSLAELDGNRGVSRQER